MIYYLKKYTFILPREKCICTLFFNMQPEAEVMANTVHKNSMANFLYLFYLLEDFVICLVFSEYSCATGCKPGLYNNIYKM